MRRTAVLLFFGLFLCTGVANATLIAHYSFDGNANDSSGNNNHGIEFGGVTYTDGVLGQAAVFDGEDDYVHVNYIAELSLSEWTISAWIYLDAIPTSAEEPYPVVVRENSGQYYNYALIARDSPSADPPGFYANGQYEIFGDEHDHYVRAPIKDSGEWILLTYTRSNAGVSSIYHNGVLSDSHIWMDDPAQAETPMYIGRGQDYHTSQHWFDGNIDDVRIYNQALSPNEIQQLYNAPVPEPGTVVLLTTGLLGIAGVRRRRRKA